MKNILTVLSSDDRKEITNAVKNIIIEQFRDDLDAYDYYIFEPDRLNSIFKDIIEEVKEEVKRDFKKKIMSKYETKIGKMFD